MTRTNLYSLLVPLWSKPIGHWDRIAGFSRAR